MRAIASPAGATSSTRLEGCLRECARGKLRARPPVLASPLTIRSLERLVLSANEIHAIAPPSADELAGERLFPALKHISLVDVPLARWADLEALDMWLRSGPERSAPDLSIPSLNDPVTSSPSLSSPTPNGLLGLSLGGCPLASSE